MRKVISFLATWGYLGCLPKFPGTWGTLGAVPLVYALLFLPPMAYMVIALTLTLLAIAISDSYAGSLSVPDPAEIVIDEVVGYVIAMTWLPREWPFFVAAFVVFRCLDIWKPFPISLLDRKIRGGAGIVLDDVAAGLITNLVLQVVYTHWSGGF